MKALSVRAPWWWYILHGGKDIENRDWPTNYRGRAWLHASAWYVHKDVIGDVWSMQKTIPTLIEAHAQWPHPAMLFRPRCGHIVGSVEVVDCVTSSSSPWFFGTYGFVLKNPIPLVQPVRCKGMLGFFNLPEEVRAACEAQR